MPLTNQEIRAIQAQHPTDNDPMPFAQALIAATVAKLSAGVSVEPHYHNRIKADGTIVYVPWYTPDQLQTAIAAARVQAINECAKVCDEHQGRDVSPAWNTSAMHCAGAIRALIGKETP